MNGVNIKSSENKMLSEYAWKNESVAQKLISFRMKINKRL